jgi:hypothetical protein
MLFVWEVISIYCENNLKCLNRVCVKVQSDWLVKHVVHIPLNFKALADVSYTAFTSRFCGVKTVCRYISI